MTDDTVTAITCYNDFAAIRDPWNEVLDSSLEHENVFLRHEWFDSWWQAFGNGRELLILLAHDGGRLVGIAPLMLFRDSYKGFPYKRVGFIEDPNAPSVNFIVQEGYERRSLELFLRYLFIDGNVSWHAAVLNKVPKSQETLRALLLILQEMKIHHIVRRSSQSPYIAVDTDWDTFRKRTNPKFRKQLRNKWNKLLKAGEIQFEEYNDIREAPQALEEAFRISAASWKHAGGTSMVSTRQRRLFFETLSAAASENGWLSIWLMRFNGRPIAIEYHLKHNGRTHAMRGDFDEAYKEFSPGSVLEAFIIEHCFKTNMKEYDFCGLDYRYKTRWTDLLHERNNLLIYNRSIGGSFVYFLQKCMPVAHAYLKKMKLPPRPTGMKNPRGTLAAK